MPFTRLVIALALALPVWGMAISEAEANCGLDYCPLPEDEALAPRFGRVQVLMRHVSFDLPEGEGSYLENLVRIEVQRFRNWNFGAWIAPVMLTVDDESRGGFSNPVFFAERGQPVSDAWRLIGGIQLEVPMGDSHNGIASGHAELLSYVGAAFQRGQTTVQVRGGLATSLSEGHEHAGGNAIFVNPHADEEAQVRGSVVVPVFGGAFQPAAFFTGRRVLGELASDEERTFLTGGLGGSYELTKSLRLQGQVEVPLGDAQRFAVRAGLGLSYTM